MVVIEVYMNLDAFFVWATTSVFASASIANLWRAIDILKVAYYSDLSSYSQQNPSS